MNQLLRQKAIEKIALTHNKEQVCFYCNNPLNLQIDHINNDGNLERIKLGQYDIYITILFSLSNKEIISKYQLLCKGCNISKGYKVKKNKHPIPLL